ncbi:MFS transporter [Desertibaculum subflavum]|uniref:MFS transporter n=1 Tax=Desertibaculum subflavum TaxID=2268458 RepID=UPI0013C52FBF
MAVAAAAGSLGRDARVIGFIGVAHGISHFYQLILPPLFPAIKDELSISYTALGFAVSLLYAVSGICQTAAGFVVDRFGAHRVLVGGLALCGVGAILAGLAQSYPMLLLAVVIAALGNSVFHPADFAILNGSVSAGRIGRAYSMHGFLGNLGWVAAPATIFPLSLMIGWRGALMTVGLIGIVAAIVIATQYQVLRDDRSAARAGHGGAGEPTAPTPIGVLFSTPVLLCFSYFVFLAMALIGLQSFLVSTLEQLYAVPVEAAQIALTAFLFGSSAGVLAGGFLADWTTRHDAVAAIGLAIGSSIALLLALETPPAALLAVFLAVTGFAMGSTNPSRDMLIRAATPKGSSGRVYGFVYSGLDLGSSLTPVAFGWLLDHGEPRLVFYAVAGVLALAILTVAGVGRQVQRLAVAPAE